MKQWFPACGWSGALALAVSLEAVEASSGLLMTGPCREPFLTSTMPDTREPGPAQCVPGVLEHPARPDGMDSAGSCYRGRVAPSPTGYLHVGHARTFWAAAQRAESARAQGHPATLVMRVDDMDGARSKAEFTEAGYEDLQWLGIKWQEGPDVGGPFAPYVQSQRMDLYRDALEVLKSKGMVYPCCCSRKDIAAALSAPHQGDEEPVYPGTCRPTPAESVLHEKGHAEAAARLQEHAEHGMTSGLAVPVIAAQQEGFASVSEVGEAQVQHCRQDHSQKDRVQECGPIMDEGAQQVVQLGHDAFRGEESMLQAPVDGCECQGILVREPSKAQPNEALNEGELAAPASQPVLQARAASQGDGEAGPGEDIVYSFAQPPSHDEAWHASHSMAAHANTTSDHSKSQSSSAARQQLKATRRAEREAKQAQAREARLARQRQQSSTGGAKDSSEDARTQPHSRRSSGVQQAAAKWSWRFRVPEEGTIVRFTDNGLGVQEFVVGKDFGDFVVWRHDDLPAYQLACVVDDALMHITEVVRGADLLVSTARQLLLAWALGYDNIPAYYHCPLVCDADNKRLAKRSDALSIRVLRAAGKLPIQLLTDNAVDLVAY